MIDGTSIAKNGAFERIYASSFYFDEQGVARWPAQVINYTNKTQFLFRIEKGVLDVNDPGVNESFRPEDIRVPFRNMVYIGDSVTDIPCMRLVNSFGGHSVGVYDPVTKDRSKVNKMMRENRIGYYAPADYSEGTELDRLIKAIVDATAAREILENIHYQCKKETEDADQGNSREQQIKLDLINALDNSGSFATTHTLIKDLKEVKNWKTEEKETLFGIAAKNGQVYYILNDQDVRGFYSGLLKGYSGACESAEKIRKKMREKKQRRA